MEDQLARFHSLEEQISLQHSMVGNASRSFVLTQSSARAGTQATLDLIKAKVTLLNNQILYTKLISQRLVARIALVKAMGG